ncbi:Elongation factor 1-gamma [Quaeritorhiza haematococci]|nr:Elongation factor 1-gamma [Quaeritorhiza haematococci]
MPATTATANPGGAGRRGSGGAGTKKLTVFVVGPEKSGKTSIANFLADISESLNGTDYHPTQGVRILEFERKISIMDPRKQKNKDLEVAIELWDCGGDSKFQNVWPAVSSSANAVIFVYSPDARQEKDLDPWWNHFSFLKETQCAVFAHNILNPSQKGNKPRLGKAFSKMPVIFTSLDHEADQIKVEFDKLIKNAYTAWSDMKEKDEMNFRDGLTNTPPSPERVQFPTCPMESSETVHKVRDIHVVHTATSPMKQTPRDDDANGKTEHADGKDAQFDASLISEELKSQMPVGYLVRPLEVTDYDKDPNNPRVAKVLIAAKYNGLEVEVAPVEMGVTNKSADFLAKFPLGKVPAFETPDGFTLFESNAIAYYVAASKQGTQLLGKDAKEAAKIQQWIAMADNELSPAQATWIYPIMGWIPANEQNTQKAKEDTKKVLTTLNKHLLKKTFLVGESITLADITVVTSLLTFYKLVFDPSFRAPFKNVTRWFTTCINQPFFKEVVGEVKFAETMAVAAAPAAAKKEAKKEKKAESPKAAAPKKEKPKKEEPEEDFAKEEKPKEKNPLDLLPPSKFNLEDWKRFYSNNDTRPTAINYFWENYDPAGFSIWRVNYKYNSELTLTFMSSNLVGGFFQRLERARKYAFGSMLILGEDNKNEIAGYFVFRGQDVPFEVRDAADYESYEFKKVDPIKDNKQKELFNAFIAWDPTVEGKKFCDGKVFK